MNELALYYRQYHETMKHWHRVLPGKVLDVHYEETVGDFEAQVRRILAHCGLPFEEACLRFHETQRAGADRELRAGASAALYARARHLAALRAAPRPVAGGARRTSSRSCRRAVRNAGL